MVALSLQFVSDVVYFFRKCPNNVRNRNSAVPQFVALNAGHTGEAVRLLVKSGHAGNKAVGMNLKLCQQGFQVGGVRFRLVVRRRCQNRGGLSLLVRGQSGNFQRGPLGDFVASVPDRLLGFWSQVTGSLNELFDGTFADTQLFSGVLRKGLSF